MSQLFGLETNPSFASSKDIPDLTGKTAIVTGGNTGIGFQVCQSLLQKNCCVIMAARSRERAKRAIEDLLRITGKRCHFLELHLDDLQQVASVAHSFVNRDIALDLLINNAGVAYCPFSKTKYGLEIQFATNYMGHFCLTLHLMPALLKSRKPRIVNLSSYAHWHSPKNGIDFENLNNERALNTWQRYGQSKLAMILFTRALNKRYGDRIYVNAVHPGLVHTDAYRGFAGFLGGEDGLFGKILHLIWNLGSPLCLTPEQGAVAVLYAATSPEIENEGYKGRYMLPFGHVTGKMSALASDNALSEQLWKFSKAVLEQVLG